jgi:hypothetical protein
MNGFFIPNLVAANAYAALAEGYSFNFTAIFCNTNRMGLA